jgi:hypothetical protein
MSNYELNSLKVRVPSMSKTIIGIGAILSAIALSACNGDSTGANNAANNANQVKNGSQVKDTFKKSDKKRLKEDEFLLKMGSAYIPHKIFNF